MSGRGCRSTSTLSTCTLPLRSTGKSHLLASRAPPSVRTRIRVCLRAGSSRCLYVGRWTTARRRLAQQKHWLQLSTDALLPRLACVPRIRPCLVILSVTACSLSPSHYAANCRVPLGSTVLKHRLLRNLGVKLCVVRTPCPPCRMRQRHQSIVVNTRK
jgi:hypothetical protein